MNTVESSSNDGDSDNKLTSKGGFTEMKKLFFIGLAFVLALTIGAGAAFATPDSTPKLLVTKMVELVENGLNCTISSMNNITNNGDMMVNATRVTDTVYGQTGGQWEVLYEQEDTNNGSGYEIAVDGSIDVDFLFEEIVIPDEVRALKIEVVVEVEGSDDVFDARWSLEFEDEEPVDPVEPVDNDSKGDTVPAVKTELHSGNSYCWHFSGFDGTSGRLNCQIKDGYLNGVFNGTGLDPEVDCYRLYYGDDELGIGTPNKAGKVHIKASGQINVTGDQPTVDDLSLVPCETPE